MTLPIACTLTRGELAARRDGLLPGLLAKASARESVCDRQPSRTMGAVGAAA